ncbi:RNA-directed DNA polymerase (reverse transcriptase)-related family protein [Rhynchospora pubera]|uniref:RNA-directed DNA polymerase (Reverse transcriptase)-related family protein n=1 Tax=Rhynchospora pubera TaxID=906938 RepID=A0AAV8CJ90_9POAL|nr:RNA-directed DNA polymerase (reverse transcriptase)-related family protein [Rhynchospora pubera]
MATTKMRNKFAASLNVQGRTVTDPREILSFFHGFYCNLLGTEAKTCDFNPSVLYQDDSSLLYPLGFPFSEFEIKKTVMGLSDSKACGPDGFPNEFFKIHWDLIKGDMVDMFDSLAQHKLDLSSSNLAHLILLPKKDDAQEMSEFRPISIVSYLPKLIAKVLANRITQFLPTLVSPSQTGFIKGRLISENFITAREMIFNISKSAEPSFMLKLDFHKAFDSMSWPFLLKTMRCRSFPRNFLCWLELLFNSSCSALLINGMLGPTFKHQRGLRQGDPLSPSLFLLVADVLARMMQSTALTLSDSLSPKLLDPFYILQYADDTLIFSTAKGQAPRSLLLVLDLFSKVSGMSLNLSKSSFVPFNLQSVQISSLQNLLQCPSTTLPVQYLGLPLSNKRPNKATFQLLVDKLTKRLAGWKAKLLSRAGRLVLASSVLSTILIFFMSVFKLPVWVVRAIDRIRRDFIWKGPVQHNRGVNLLSWDIMCLPKQLGGSGLINLTLHNISLLLRWWWRVHDLLTSQWTSTAKLLYGVNGRLSTPLAWKQAGSFFWTDLRNLRFMFQLLVTSKVHSGDSTLFWYNNWAGSLLRFFSSERSFPNKFITLKEAIPRIDMLLTSPQNVVDSNAYGTAQNLHLTSGSDRLLWRWRTDGRFSTSLVYKQLVSAGKCSFAFKNLWKLKVPPTVRMFLVFLSHGRILTQDQLLKRNIPFQPKCVMFLIVENKEHLFCVFIFAQNIWTRLHFNTSAVSTVLHNLCNSNSLREVTLATTLWGLWLERNNRTFRDERRSEDDVHQWIVQQATLFWKFC